jgi:nucleoside-diphosphate-sugar epimerase
MTAAAVKGGPIRVFGDGDQRIDFVHIDDVVEANFAMLDRSPRFAIYHISADRPISLFELATRVNEWSGARARIEWVPDAGGAQARFKPHVSGLRWEETIQELGLNQPRSLDSMIHETLNALRPSAALSG